MARKGSMGCCGYFLRVLIALINIFLFFVGIGLVIVMALYRWANTFDTLKKNSVLQSFITLDIFNGITIALLVIGAFLIVISVVGFIAAVSANRCLLGMSQPVSIILQGLLHEKLLYDINKIIKIMKNI